MKSMKYMGGGARKYKRKSKQAGGVSDEPTYAGSKVKGLKYTKTKTPKNSTAPTLANEARLKSNKSRLQNKVKNTSLQSAKEKAQAPGKGAKMGQRQAGGLMGKSVIGAMGDLMKGKNAQDMKNNMKYKKGGIKKAQSSINKLPEGTAEEKAKKAKLLREDKLRQQKAGSMKPMKPVTMDKFKDEKGNISGERMLMMGQKDTNVKRREVDKLPSKKPVPPKTKSKATYAEAKAADPKLDQYIKARNNAKKGSAAYNAAQNKINAAYDRGPKRSVKAGTSEAMAKKEAPKSTVKPASERTIKTRPATAKPAAPAKPVAKKQEQAKAKAKPAKDSIVEDSKEIKFDGPSRRADRIEKKADKISKRKAKRAAIKSAKEKLKAARRS